MSPVRHPGGAEDLPSVTITITTGAASTESGDSNTFQDTASRLCAVLRRFPGGVSCDWQDQALWGGVRVRTMASHAPLHSTEHVLFAGLHGAFFEGPF